MWQEYVNGKYLRVFSENFKAHENRHSSTLSARFMYEQRVMTSIIVANVLNIYIRVWLGFFK